MDPAAAPPALSIDTNDAEQTASVEAAPSDAAATVPAAIASAAAAAVPTPDAAVTAAVSPRASAGKIVILKKRSTLQSAAASPTAAGGAPHTAAAAAAAGSPTAAAAAAGSSPRAASSPSPKANAAASAASPPLSPSAGATAASAPAQAAPSSPAVDQRSYPAVADVISKIEKQSSLAGPAGAAATATTPTATKKYTLTRKTTAGSTAAPPAAAASPVPSPTAASSSAANSAALANQTPVEPVAASAAEPAAATVAPAAAPVASTGAAVATSAPVSAVTAPSAAPSEAAATAAPLSPQTDPPLAATTAAASTRSPTEQATSAPSPATAAASSVTAHTLTPAADAAVDPVATPVAVHAAAPPPSQPQAAIPPAAVVVPLTPQKPLASAAAAVATSPAQQLVSPGAVAIAVETPLRPAHMQPPVFASSDFSPVAPLAAEPSPAAASSRKSSRARTPVLLDPLPPLSSSRRGSIDASAAPAFAGSAGLFTDDGSGLPPSLHHHHGHTPTASSMDLLPAAGTSRSRRNSVNRMSALPPLHSPTPPPQQNLTPRIPGARTATPDEPPSPSLQAPPPGASSRRHAKSPSAVPSRREQREQLHSRGASAAPTVSAEPSPSAASAGGAASVIQSRRSSRVFVGHMLALSPGARPSTGAALASQLQEVRAAGAMHTGPSLIQLQESAASRANPRTRWLWCGSAGFGLGWLTFALVYALAHPDGGYAQINPAGDRLVLACCVLYALGLALMMYVAALFWRRVSVYTSASGFLLQLGLTLSMLGLAGLVSNQSRSAVLSVLGATPVLLATQAGFVGVVWMFLLFARWVHGSPSRTTAAVLALLEGLDLSTLNRDVRTIKGMNAELIQEHTKVVAKRGTRLGQAPAAAAAAVNAVAAASNEVRPLTGHTRPGSALLDGVIPSYALGSYDSPVAGRVVAGPGGSSARASTKERKRHRSSVGRLNLPPDALLQSEAAMVLSAPLNFALPATTARRSSVDGVAMKQMMATNLQLQAKVRDLESQQQGPNWKA